MFQFYVRLRGCEGADDFKSTGPAFVTLLNWIRVLDRYNPARAPLNSDSRLHFTRRGQWRWFYWNIQLRTVALDVQHKLFIWMFADVFQQRDWIVDGGLVKPTDDVPGTQPGCRCRPFWFHFVDNRRFCRADQQRPHTLPPSSARLRFVRLDRYCLHLSVSLELHRYLIALAPHDVPADAVVHSHEAPDRFAIHGQNLIARLQAGLFRW